MSNLKRTDCGSAMEAGFLPDQGHAAVYQGSWHRGKAETEFSFSFIKYGAKWNKKETIPATAYRCTQCGLLRHYALADDEAKP